MTLTLRELRTICAEPYGFWLDTALTGRSPDEASYCGAEPFLVLRSYGDTVELWTRGSTNRFTGSPFAVLRDLLRQHRGRSGGAAGYLAYDLKRHVERLPETAVDELGLPECHLAFYERIDRFDPRPLSIEAASTPRHSPLADTAIRRRRTSREMLTRPPSPVRSATSRPATSTRSTSRSASASR